MRRPHWSSSSDHSLVVSLGDDVCLSTHERVVRLSHLLEGIPEFLNIHPSYNAVLISYDPRRTAYGRVESLLGDALQKMDSVELPAPRTVKVPMHYNGPDLADVATLHGMTVEEVIRIHAS